MPWIELLKIPVYHSHIHIYKKCLLKKKIWIGAKKKIQKILVTLESIGLDSSRVIQEENISELILVRYRQKNIVYCKFYKWKKWNFLLYK